MSYPQRRPTALVWYMRLRWLILLLLFVCLCLIIVSLANKDWIARRAIHIVVVCPGSCRSSCTQGLTHQVVVAALLNGLEVYDSKRRDLTVVRPKWVLGCLIAMDIVLAAGLCLTWLFTMWGPGTVSVPLPWFFLVLV